MLFRSTKVWINAVVTEDGKKLGLGGSSIEWLVNKLPQGAMVGVAPDMLSLLAKCQLQSAFAEKKLVLQHQEDLVDAFWHDRPTLPQGTIYIHPAEYTAQNAAEKLAAIRAVMQQKQADCHLISSLDDIAWITNLRGNDVSYNPVFLSHLLINAQQAVLFVDESKLDNSTRQWLADAGICTADYHTLDDAVGRIRGTLLISPAKVAVSSLQCLSEKVKLIEDSNPSTLFKAEKSPAEIEFVRQAMREDGIALCEKEQDYVTREILLEQLIDTEEDHAHWLEQQLRLIEMIGLQNYLQSQLGDVDE